MCSTYQVCTVVYVQFVFTSLRVLLFVHLVGSISAGETPLIIMQFTDPARCTGSIEW